MRKYGKILYVLVFAAFISFLAAVMRPSRTGARKKAYLKFFDSANYPSNSENAENLSADVKKLEKKDEPAVLAGPARAKNITGGYWKSGLPYMDIKRKLRAHEFTFTSISDIKLEMGTIGDLHLPFQKLLAEKSGKFFLFPFLSPLFHLLF